jgi:acyl-coenzyme A synthetase/AMP-(fatty) acid ligase
LWVSTPFQAAGYLGPRAPDDGFAGPPPGVDAHGFFRSRDLVRRDAAGDLFLEGRTDSQVKVRGVRVNLQAVEQALLADPAVAEAAVVAVDDGVAGRRLVAVLRRRPGTRVDTLALRRRCARDLGRIAVPGIIDIQDDALPKTTTGKVDRTAVRRERQRRAA